MKIPIFRELAELRIAEAGPLDKTINIKVGINTARMMVESENTQFGDLLKACEWAMRSIHHPACKFNKSSYICTCHVGAAKAAIAAVKGRQ